MASELIHLSNKFSLSANGGEFSAGASSFSLTLPGPTIVAIRAGAPAVLAQKIGYVIRGVQGFVDIAGLGNDAVFSTAAIAGFGSTMQSLVAQERIYNAYEGRPVSPSWHTRWEWDVPDTSVPLGLLYPGADNVNSGQWTGMATGSFVINPSGVAQTATNYRLESVSPRSQLGYWVSPKPQWVATAPSSLGAGQVGEVVVSVAYPGGEPVVGLGIWLASLTDAAVLGAGAYSLAVTTDAAGRVSVPVQAVASGAAVIEVALNDPRCAPEFFSPAFGATLPINASVVRVDGKDCVLVPAVAAVPEIPATSIEALTNAWDSGANSETILSGDVMVEFHGAQTVAGAVVGFTDDREAVPDPERIAHGWYLHTDLGGMTWAQVYESGKLRSARRYYTPETVFRIERRGARVSYLMDGERVFATQSDMGDEVSVGASLYGAEDYLFEWEEGSAPVDGGEVDTFFTVVNGWVNGTSYDGGITCNSENVCGDFDPDNDISGMINSAIYGDDEIAVEAMYPVSEYSPADFDTSVICGFSFDDVLEYARVGAKIETDIPFASGLNVGGGHILVVYSDQMPPEFSDPAVTFAVAVLGGPAVRDRFPGRKLLGLFRVREDS